MEVGHRKFRSGSAKSENSILDFQHSIADGARDVAELADQRGLIVPPSMADAMLELVRRVVAACDEAEAIIDELDELVETGFTGREMGRVEEMISQLSHTQSDTDRLAETVHRQLFALEDEHGVGSVFWWELVSSRPWPTSPRRSATA